MLSKILCGRDSATIIQTESEKMGERYHAYLDDFPLIEAYGETKEIVLDKLKIVMDENSVRTI